MKFIIVYHTWFIKSKGFIVEVVEAKSEDEAFTIASAFSFNNQTVTTYFAFTLIEIAANESISTRKLTIKQRLLGRV